MFVPWIDAPCAITDGNGIIVDDGRNTQNGSTNGIYTGRTLIENNIVYENGGRGIHVFESDKVDILNNTVYNNGQSTEINDGEITAIFADDIKVYNNIIYAKTTEPLNSVNGTNISYDYNLNFNSSTYDQLGANSVIDEAPQFYDLNNYDFRPSSDSPAINAGNNTPGCFATTDITGLERVDAAPDMGAYEFSSALAVTYLNPLSATLEADGVQLEWSTSSEVNNSHFEILYAQQTQALTTIDQFPAQSTDAVQYYRFLHTRPTLGINYYQIRQYDLDGTSSLSPIVAVNVTATIRIFPNPAADAVQIQCPDEQRFWVLVFDASGAMIRKVITKEGGIRIENLTKGIYAFQVLSTQGKLLKTERIVIQ